MKEFLLLIAILISTIISNIKAQDFQDSQWLIGLNSITADNIDFRKDSIVPVKKTVGIDLNGGYTISNYDGDLILYSNGCEVWNSTYERIENGEDLNPEALDLGYCESGSATPLFQSVLILKRPETEDQYFLLLLNLDRAYPGDTVFLAIAPTKLYLNTIDMVLNGGDGKVISKNITTLQDTFSRGYLTAVRHANGRDWYVLLPKSHTNCYFLMYLNTTGLSIVDTICTGKIWGDIENIGQAAFSPDGNYYARTHGAQGLHVYSFDRCIGELNYLQELLISIDTVSGAGVAFSPNSRFLYASNNLQLFQFDLYANDIQASKVLIGEWVPGLPPHIKNFYQLQLAPDGKIYTGSTGNFQSLHIIHDPNKKGDSCNLEMGGLVLNGSAFFRIPLFPHYKLGPLDSSPCDTLGINNEPVAYFRISKDSFSDSIKFINLSYGEPQSYYWDFGDGNFSNDVSPLHYYNSPGVYEICLTAYNLNGSHQFCKEFNSIISSHYYIEKNSTLKVYPNPANKTISIKILTIGEFTVSLFTSIGQRIWLPINNLNDFDSSIDISSVPNGLYFIQVQNNEGIVYIEKVVITH